MKCSVRRILRVVVMWGMAVSAGYGSASLAAQPPLNPQDYPRLDDKQLGHIRHMLKLSSQPPGEWDGMGSSWFDTVERSLQYQLAFMTYALALAQYHYTPAYYDPYRSAIDADIQRILLPDIWQTWALASRGGSVVDPDQKQLKESALDPCAKDNIMLCGHVFQMAAMYEMFYRAHKYDQPGSLSFDFNTGSWGFGRQVFAYDLHKFARNVVQQFKDSNYAGIACEPDQVFPECNQHPILALMDYDYLYGTHFAQDVMPKYKAVWLEKGYVDPATKSYMQVRLQRQDKVLYGAEAWGDGWTGVFMHAWDKEYVESLYPFQKARHIDWLLHGKPPTLAKADRTPWEARIGFGMFAILASEIGDKQMRDSMLDYVDRNWAPVWEGGQYYYPRNDDMTLDKNGISHAVDNLAANALIPMARLDVPNGVWALYNHPWSENHLAQPYITGVDLLTTSVSQAVYVPEKRALLVTVVAGPIKAKQVSFKVGNLDRARGYNVWKDGKIVGQINGSGAGNTGLSVDAGGNATITTTLTASHTYIVVAQARGSQQAAVSGPKLPLAQLQ